MKHRRIQTTVFALFLAFLVAPLSLWGTNPVAGMDEGFQLLAQTIPSFKTIECSFVVEESTDGKNWKKVSRKKAIWDDVEKSLNLTEIKVRNEKEMEIVKVSFYKGKVVKMEAPVDFDPKFPMEPKFSKNQPARCLIYTDTLPLMTGFRHFDYLSFFHVAGDSGYFPMSQMFSTGDDAKEVKIAKDASGKITTLTLGYSILEMDMDKQTIRQNTELVHEDGIELLAYRAESYHEKDGFIFPKSFLVRQNDRASWFKRVTLEPESLKINRKYSKNDFMITLPVGTLVSDNIQGRMYALERKLDMREMGEIEKQLKELVAKSKKPK